MQEQKQSSISNPEKCNDSIFKFYSPPNNPQLEIFFFHDVSWSKKYDEPHVQSWMSGRAPIVCWPEAWLKSKYPNARILSFCYDAAIKKTGTEGRMPLFSLVENLRQDILPMNVGKCPIILVGHGFGGLIIKALIESMEIELQPLDWCVSKSKERKSDKNLHKLKSFVDNVKGILYFAPPFLGTKLADSMKDSPDPGSLLKLLEVGNKEISHLNEWFRKWRKARRCRATAIVAALPTILPRPRTMVFLSWRITTQWPWRIATQAFWPWSVETQVVEEPSSRYDVDIVYTSSRDHYGVCQPPDQTDSSFHRLTELIDEAMGDMPCGPSRQINDESETACSELVTKILSRLPEPGGAMYLRTNDFIKISKFPELNFRLMEGLGRFECTSVSGGRGLWEYKM